MSQYTTMSDEQLRMMIETRQSYEAYKEAVRIHQGYVGSMSWQKSKGREYLARRKKGMDGKMKASSLGSRSPETEELMEKFREGKEQARIRLSNIQDKLKKQAGYNRVQNLGRVPRTPAKILRTLDKEGLLGQNVQVVGTNALYAYEAFSGVFFETGILATGDLDILMDARSHLNLTIEGLKPKSLMEILKSCDKSFEISNRNYRAINDEGYFVDLIKPEATPPWKDEQDSLGSDDLKASPIEALKWIQSSPKFKTVAIDLSGQPTPIVCPDPRAFAIFKFFTGRLADNRDPVKQMRDLSQGKAVLDLLQTFMTHLPIEKEHLKFFPENLLHQASENFDF